MKIKHVKFASEGYGSNLQKEIVLNYWEHNESLKFINQSYQVRAKFNIEQNVLIKLVKTYSKFTFYSYCSFCDSYEFNSATSQFNFNKQLSKCRSVLSPYQCHNCKKNAEDEIAIVLAKKRELLKEKQTKAINEKRWQELDFFLNELLSNCLDYDLKTLKKIYWDKLGKSMYWKLFKGLNTLEYFFLLTLKKEPNGYVSDYKCIPKLRKNFKLLTEYKAPNEGSKSDINSEANELKLTVNDYKKKPGSSIFTGVFTLSKRVVLDSGVEYSFAQLARENNSLFIVMTPSNRIISSSQKANLKTPIILKDALKDFLSTIKPKGE